MRDATTLVIDPYLPADWRMGIDNAPELSSIAWKNKPLASLANMAAVRFQMHKLSHGKAPNPKASPLRALIEQQTATMFGHVLRLALVLLGRLDRRSLSGRQSANKVAIDDLSL